MVGRMLCIWFISALAVILFYHLKKATVLLKLLARGVLSLEFQTEGTRFSLTLLNSNLKQETVMSCLVNHQKQSVLNREIK